MRNSLRWLLALFGLVLAPACGDGPETKQPNNYQEPGPYAVGVTTRSLADREVEIWYPVDPGTQGNRDFDTYYIRDWLPDYINDILPADANPPFVTDAYRDAPASDNGPFPLVLFAHGASSYRNQSTFLTTHLASWGFVVASPDYLERGLANALQQPPEIPVDDMTLSRQTVELAARENALPSGPLEGRISTERIAITGHSAGGGTSLRFGAEADVVTYIPLSAGAWRDGTTFPDKPSMWLTGDIDGVVEVESVTRAFESAASPTYLVIVEKGGHLAPSDICAIGASGGGVVQIAIDAGLPVPPGLQRLGTDGCQTEALAVELGWPIFNYFVTAQLMSSFGLDDTPITASEALRASFGDAKFEFKAR